MVAVTAGTRPLVQQLAPRPGPGKVLVQRLVPELGPAKVLGQGSAPDTVARAAWPLGAGLVGPEWGDRGAAD